MTERFGRPRDPPWPRTPPPSPRFRPRCRRPSRRRRQPRPSARRGAFILPLVLIGAAAYGAHWGYGWFTEGRFLVSTDDAYVGANTVIVSPKITGYVADVLVKNNQEVRAGDVLARIDAGDYRLAVDAAKDKVGTQDATIARIGRQVEAQRAMIAQSEAQIGSARAAAEQRRRRRTARRARIRPRAETGADQLRLAAAARTGERRQEAHRRRRESAPDRRSPPRRRNSPGTRPISTFCKTSRARPSTPRPS